MIAMTTATAYPVRVDATFDPRVSRWQWLVKWLLAIPHYVILAFLWLAFAALSVVAFVAILATGHYPRSIFEFNVGVLRWTWRVQYYAYGALATDHYPPFTLAEVPDYPAHLRIAYPERLSRGLVLVKSWLLALPHYLVIGLFTSGAVWGGWWYGHLDRSPAWFGGLISLLAVFAGIAVLFTGRYPRGLFDLVLGLNRWVLRVAAYATLMTDAYPPFRLDLGGDDPASTLTVPPPQPPPTDQVPTGHSGWTGGRITSVVIGAVLGLLAIAGLAAGGTALWADQSLRDANGYLTIPATTVHTDGYALTSADIHLIGPAVRNALGDVRVSVTPTNPSARVFVGIAPSATVDTYLAGVAHSTVTAPGTRSTVTLTYPGGAPAGPPETAAFWSAQLSGAGEQTLAWSPDNGQWTVVVMNADGSPGLTATVVAGATVPVLGAVAIGLLVFGVIALAGATLLIAVPIRRAGTGQPAASPDA